MNFTIENNILKGDDRPIDTNQKLGQLIYGALNESPDHVSQVSRWLYNVELDQGLRLYYND